MHIIKAKQHQQKLSWITTEERMGGREERKKNTHTRPRIQVHVNFTRNCRGVQGLKKNEI